MVEQTKGPNLDGLNALASRAGGDIKPTLLRVMTDLYLQKPVHTDEEELQYIELSARLIPHVDAATRAAVAQRLAFYPSAPQVVMDRLEQERIQRDEPHYDAIPQPTEASLVQAPAPSMESVHEPVQAAPAISPLPATAATPAELSEIFLAADADERRMILLHLEYSALPEAKPVAPQFIHDAIRRLEMAALNHSSERFAHEVERWLGIARTLARRLIEDESGEPILVIASALGMPPDTLQRILLCLSPTISHSVLRVYELSTLYEELDPLSASRLTAIWQAAGQLVRPRVPVPHQPQHYDDGRDHPALPARPTVRWEEHALRREGER